MTLLPKTLSSLQMNSHMYSCLNIISPSCSRSSLQKHGRYSRTLIGRDLRALPDVATPRPLLEKPSNLAVRRRESHKLPGRNREHRLHRGDDGVEDSAGLVQDRKRDPRITSHRSFGARQTQNSAGDLRLKLKAMQRHKHRLRQPSDAPVQLDDLSQQLGALPLRWGYQHNQR